MESFHPYSKQIGRGNLEIISVSAEESAASNQNPNLNTISLLIRGGLSYIKR